MTCTTQASLHPALHQLAVVFTAPRLPAPGTVTAANDALPAAAEDRFLGLSTRFIAAARQYLSTRNHTDVMAYMDWFNNLTWSRDVSTKGRSLSYTHLHDIAVRMDLSTGMIYLSWQAGEQRRRFKAASWAQVHAFILARYW